MIERILPIWVASSDALGDVSDAEMFRGEAAAVDRAIDSRRREFAAARACARQALAKLGISDVEILQSTNGAPRWPPGVVGSITHCDGFRGAAVANSCEVLTVGIDAEPNESLPSGVRRRVASATETIHLAALGKINPAVRWDRLLFSAKESTYKAWFPLTHAWLGFEDAEITIDPTGGTFESQLLVDAPGTPEGKLDAFSGRWIMHAGLVVTAIAQPIDTRGDID